MNKKVFLLTSLFLIICLLNASISTHQNPMLQKSKVGNSDDSNYKKISKVQELMSWWNESFEYRVKVSITEKAGVNFDLYPINVFLEFEYGHAQKNSIRVLYWDGNKWVGPIISQVWNKTLYSGGVYLKSATVTFLANLTAYSTADYYIYYSKYDRGIIKFKEMVSGYESSPGSQDYYFEGTYYKVLTNHLKGGKIYQLWHKSTGQEIGNPGSPGDTTYPTHYDPYASQLGHTYGTAINVEGIIEDGPIFIKYHATASFSGSYDDKAEIYYTFYWFGWITEINSSCNDQVDWNYYYPNLWIFDPGSMNGLYYYRESPEAEYQNDNFATGTSNSAYTYGNVTKVAFYAQGSGNAFGYVEIDSKRYNFYDGGRLHYFYYYSSYYQYWYERYNSVTNGENSWKYDKFAMIVWNGRDGLNVFKEMSEEFRKAPEFQVSSERVIFKLGVNVINDEGNPVDGANVFIYDGTNLIGSNVTINGYATLPIDHSGTYTIYVNYTTNYMQGSNNIVVSSTGSISFSYPADIIATKTKTISLPMGTVTITVVDLLNRCLGSDAYIEIYKNGLSVMPGVRTNSNGQLTLENFPFGSYDIYTSYQPTTRDIEYWITRATYDTITITSSNKDILIQQPIGDLLVSVKAYDNQGMSDLLITLTNQSNVNGFQQHSVLTNSSGIAYFYRIENTRWKLQLNTKDSYNQSYSLSKMIYSLNSTISSSTVNLLIPFTRLNVYVDVGGISFEGAEVDVRKYTNTELLSSGTTNSSGFITFEYILEGKYNVTVEIYGSKQSKNVYVSTNYTAVLSFSFPGITYAPEDSVLLNGNSTNVFFNYYYDNITLKVNYFNRTGVSPDFSDTAINDAENITIWIYIGNTLIYHITKADSLGASMIQVLGNGTYFIRISTSYLKLNVSSSYYTVKVLIYNTSYSMPTPISYLLKVVTVETYSTISKTEIEVSWSSNILFQVNYVDDYHNLPIKDANITIAISGVNVLYSYVTTLDSNSMLPNGTYVVDLNTAKIGLTPGIYTLSVYMSKQNYYDQIKTISVTIIDVPTNLTVFSQPTDYVNWSSTFIIVASYTYNNGSPVLDAHVYAKIQSTNILLSWNGTYYVSNEINSTIFTPGFYSIPLNASKQFHEQKFATLNLEIKKAYARMSVFVNETKMLSSEKFNVTYSEDSNLTITVVYKSDMVNITNATVILIIPSINIQVLLNETDSGIYVYSIPIRTFFASQFLVYVKATHQNYSDTTLSFFLNVKSRWSYLYINSKEISVIWGEKPTIIVSFKDDRNRTISDATITANWTETGIIFYRQGDVYVATIDTQFGKPGTYLLLITASAVNYEYKEETVVLNILSPVEFDIPSVVRDYWLKTINITVALEDVYTNRSINDAIIRYDWEFGNGTFTPAGRGTYFLELNLTKYPTGEHIMNVTVEKEGFPKITKQVKVIIDPVPLEIRYPEILSGTEIELGQNLTVKLILEDTVLHRPINNANVTLALYEKQVLIATYLMKNIGNGTYYITVSTGDFTLGSYLVKITAQKENYAPPNPYIFTLLIQEPTVNLIFTRIPISTITFSSGVAVSIVGILGVGLYSYKLYKIPWIIRSLDKVLRNIAQGKGPIDFSKYPEVDKVLKEALEDFFSKVKKEPPIIRIEE